LPVLDGLKPIVRVRATIDLKSMIGYVDTAL
jgi:hypothetical protein